ncbi:MAG TPA: hypothetical protein VFZ04_21210, partial [Longimicrobiales bacterium]
MKDRPMHDVEQGLPERERASTGSRRFILSWKILLPIATILLILAFWPLRSTLPAPAAELSYTELVRAIDAGRVASMSIEPGYGVRGRWTTSAADAVDFIVLYTAADPAPLLQRAERRGVTVSFRRVGASDAYRAWISNSALVIFVLSLVGVLLYQLRQQFGGGSSVGQRSTGGATSFRDVAGTQGAAEELHEIVEFLKSPAAFA